MPMTPVTVTARLKNARGAALVGAVITCELTKADFAVGGSIALPGVVTAQTDVNGEATLLLMSTAAGSLDARYTISVSHYSMPKPTTWTGVDVPLVQSISLTVLLGGRDFDIPVGAVEISGGYFILTTGTPVFY